MKQERLLALTTYLLSHGKTSAGALAERFEVSERTIYRDIEALSLAGVPVYTERGQGGGVALLPDFTLPRLPLEEQEREALFMALASLCVSGIPQANTALEKLQAVFARTEDAGWVQVDYTSFDASPGEQETFQRVRRSILERRLIGFCYFSLRHETTQRVVEPMKLLYRGHTWYLWGFCRERGDLRLFKLLRMQEVEVLPEVFSPRPGLPPLDEFLRRDGATPQRPPIAMQLRFTPAARFRAMEFFPESMRREELDGSTMVHYTCPEDEWVYGFLLSFGGDVEVLAPQRLRDLLRERILAAARYYEER